MATAAAVPTDNADYFTLATTVWIPQHTKLVLEFQAKVAGNTGPDIDRIIEAYAASFRLYVIIVAALNSKLSLCRRRFDVNHDEWKLVVAELRERLSAAGTTDMMAPVTVAERYAALHLSTRNSDARDAVMAALGHELSAYMFVQSVRLVTVAAAFDARGDLIRS